jgi:phosphonate degradation associated HDIG domain protein
MSNDAPSIVEHIFSLYREHGDLEYGERVTITEHCFQCAVFAERAGADETMIATAFLHDIGHFVHGLDEDIAERGIDGCHEEAGAAILQQWFGPEVCEPVRLHVPAKRYLCTTDPDYYATLSPASVLSLQVQGGPFTREACAEFERNPHYQRAIELRRYDEMGKEPGMETPEFDYYRPMLERLIQDADGS